MRLLAILIVVVGCGGSTIKQPEVPAPAVDSTPAPLAAADLDALARKSPHADAPPELRQYGQLEGVWMCRGAQRQPDGSWKTQPHESRWTWFYTLGGHAIQDIFISPPETGGGVGTNIRVYDVETRKWTMVWTTSRVKAFDTFEAKYLDGTIVMHGELPARGPFPAHQARITFHDITPIAFSWKYEGGKIGGDQFQEFSRLACRREGEPATLATDAEIAAWQSADDSDESTAP